MSYPVAPEGPVPVAPRAVVDRLRAAGCVFAEEEAALLVAAAGTTETLDDLVARRVDGFPLEHLLGWVELAGRRVLVDPGVFVPRQRTALLVREAARLVADGAAGAVPVVVDLCCGSGALGVVLVSLVGPAELHAADVEPAAVRCARRNVEPLGGHVHEGDLFDALPPGLRGRVDVLLCNVPYVPTGALGSMPPEARDHEPAVALDGGPDGLDVLRRVAAGAPGWLAPGGSVLMETSEEQAPTAVRALADAGLAARVVGDEQLGATGVVGTRTDEQPHLAAST